MSDDYIIKHINEDFQVTEVPLLPEIKGTGKYIYLWIKKKNYTTFEVEDICKDFFSVSFEDINVEGLKDEDGITSQLFSIHKTIKEVDIEDFNKTYSLSDKFVYIERIVGYGDLPVQEKKLHGNIFKLVVRNISENTFDILKNILQKNRNVSFVNYYDDQRFGLPNGVYNTHIIGKHIINSDTEALIKEIRLSKDKTWNVIDIDRLQGGIKIMEELRKKINYKKILFYVASYNSYLWNTHISKKLEFFHEGHCMQIRDIFELFVPNSKIESFETGKIIEYGLDDEGNKEERDISNRDTVVHTNVFISDIEDDEFFKGKHKVTLQFFLPTGCYATMFIKQLFHKVIYEQK